MRGTEESGWFIHMYKARKRKIDLSLTSRKGRWHLFLSTQLLPPHPSPPHLMPLPLSPSFLVSSFLSPLPRPLYWFPPYSASSVQASWGDESLILCINFIWKFLLRTLLLHFLYYLVKFNGELLKHKMSIPRMNRVNIVRAAKSLQSPHCL